MARIWNWCRQHPLATLVLAGGSTAGALIAVHFELGPSDLAVWKRALGGAIAGAWFALFPLGSALFD